MQCADLPMAIMMMMVIQNFDDVITMMLMMQENKDNSMYRPNNGDHDDIDKVKYTGALADVFPPKKMRIFHDFCH